MGVGWGIHGLITTRKDALPLQGLAAPVLIWFLLPCHSHRRLPGGSNRRRSTPVSTWCRCSRPRKTASTNDQMVFFSAFHVRPDSDPTVPHAHTPPPPASPPSLVRIARPRLPSVPFTAHCLHPSSLPHAVLFALSILAYSIESCTSHLQQTGADGVPVSRGRAEDHV